MQRGAIFDQFMRDYPNASVQLHEICPGRLAETRIGLFNDDIIEVFVGSYLDTGEMRSEERISDQDIKRYFGVNRIFSDQAIEYALERIPRQAD